MSALCWLSDEQWAAIEPKLPKNQPGARRVDDRRVISGIFHVLKTGCRWCDCPAEYGPATTIYNRFNRWSRRLFGTGLLETLAQSSAVTKTTPSRQAPLQAIAVVQLSWSRKPGQVAKREFRP